MILHASCEAGLESVLAEELTALGATEVLPVRRGVDFQGDREVLWRANLQCRTANRILMRLAQFSCPGRDALYAGASRVRWEEWLGPDQTMAVSSVVRGAPKNLVNQVVKDAVCDRLRRVSGRRPDVERQDPDIPIHLHLVDDQATLSLDASGTRLHRRGYRTETREAPLKETLAAGILLLSGWDGEAPLYDPMCGSGTFLIEAALLARGIAPGLRRLERDGEGYAFMRWAGFEAAPFERVVQRIRSVARRSAPGRIIGRDRQAGAVDIALRNAQRAGVLADVELERGVLLDAEPPGADGIMVTNPPYGERIGEFDELALLYADLGDILKQRFAGWEAWVLAGEPALVKKIGLRTSKKIPLWNGAIECRLLRLELFEGGRRERLAQRPSDTLG